MTSCGTRGAPCSPATRGRVIRTRRARCGFVSRPLGPDVTAEAAFNDVKTVLEFLLTAEAQLAEAQLAEAVGLEAGPGED